jgi:hypothetical protein
MSPRSVPFDTFALARFVLPALLTACSSLRQGQTVLDDASWLAAAFDSKALHAAPPLRKVYQRAAAECRTLHDLVEQQPRPTTSQLEEARCALRTIRSRVANAEQNATKVATLHQQLERRLQLVAMPTAGQPTERLAEMTKQLQASISQLQGQEEPSAEAIAAAERALATPGPGEPQSPEVRGAVVKEQVKSRLAVVNTRLEAERKKKSDSTRVRGLERAQSMLQEANALLQGATPNEYQVAEAERMRREAEEVLDTVDADILLFASPWFLAHTGALSISPYRVGRNTGPFEPDNTPAFRLQRADRTTSAYLGLDFLHRRAWLDPEQVVTKDEEVGLGLPSWMLPTDYSVRLLLANSTVSDATTAAGGDWMAESSIGWNVAGFGLKDADACRRQPELKKLPQGTINFEVGGGISTNRGALDGFEFVRAGLATVWSFPFQIRAETWRTARLVSGLYYGLHDFPQLDSDDGQYITANRPAFNQLGAMCATVDFVIPISSSLDAIFSGTYWDAFGSDRMPETWSLFVGVTLPIGRILKATLDSTD